MVVEGVRRGERGGRYLRRGRNPRIQCFQVHELRITTVKHISIEMGKSGSVVERRSCLGSLIGGDEGKEISLNYELHTRRTFLIVDVAYVS